MFKRYALAETIKGCFNERNSLLLIAKALDR